MRAMRIILFALIALFLVGITKAIDFPMPIVGQVGVGNVHVEVRNARTGISMQAVTSPEGEFLVDWSNSDSKGGTITRIQNGDIMHIALLGCDSPLCVKDITYSGQPQIVAAFEVKSLFAAKCPACEACDKSPLGIGAIISALVVFIGTIGGGISIYRNKLGKVMMQHKHLGGTSYHDPNKLHPDPKFKHRLWKDDPVGCMTDIERIEKNGGLV